mmetsp:Transcript_30304/g.44261  ORF Transcript_30304/g.44261 Transcript_30304/m.44261 type:complete len:173 (-) Transcript_30304:359-877(-)
MSLSIFTVYLLALTTMACAFQLSPSPMATPVREFPFASSPMAFSIKASTFEHSWRLGAKTDNDEDFESEVDWDAEWKKVVENKNQPASRPGKDFYKSETEIKVIQATNKAVEGAQQQIKKVQKKVVIQTPTIRSLQGDWKFWIAILAILSVGTSLIAASGQTQVYTNDSFYI